jgi:hypothetical protein
MMRKWMFTEPETKFDVDVRVGGKWSITNRATARTTRLAASI